MCNIGGRPALVKRFAMFLKERSHFTKVGDEESEFEYINGGVPQGSKIRPAAFVVHINNLPEAINKALKIWPPCEWENEGYVVIDDDSILFMDDVRNWYGSKQVYALEKVGRYSQHTNGFFSDNGYEWN